MTKKPLGFLGSLLTRIFQRRTTSTALHDVDKGSEDRGDPTPNHTDQIIDGALKSHQTISTTYRTDADTNQKTRVIFKNNMILYYDDQNRVIKVDGFIPSLANYPVSIEAIYGYDVFVDILGITGPS